jgi:hypothetical protein
LSNEVKIKVDCDVSSDLEQSKSTQVERLNAWVRGTSDSMESKLDGQVNEQFEFNSGRQIDHEVEESSFTSEQVGE